MSAFATADERPNPLLGGSVPQSEITEEEDLKLDELLEKIQSADSGIDYAVFGDYLSKPNALIRFLRARRNNADKAFTMLQSHVEWLKQIRPAEINLKDISKSMRSGCWRLICDSKKSNPTILVDLSRWNPHEYTVEEYVRMIAFFQCNVFTGKKEGVHQFCVVFDMEVSLLVLSTLTLSHSFSLSMHCSKHVLIFSSSPSFCCFSTGLGDVACHLRVLHQRAHLSRTKPLSRASDACFHSECTIHISRHMGYFVAFN